MRKATSKSTYYEKNYRGVLYWILVVLIILLINSRSTSIRSQSAGTAKANSITK